MSEAGTSRRRVAMVAAYAAPALATQFIMAPFTNVLPGMYAKYWGLDMAAIAAALLLARLFDAVSDPLVGHLSDRTRTRLGARKPWLMAGFLVTALSAWFVYVPPASPGFAYFVFWSMAFYLGWTMIEIPHTAWGAEVTQDYTGRNRVFLAKTVAAVAGTLCMALVPLLPFFETTEMTPDVMRVIALIFLLFGPVCIGFAVYAAPAGAPAPSSAPSVNIWRFVATILANRPFLRFLSAFLINGLAAGMNGVMLYIYIDSYLKLGDKMPYVLGAGVLLGLGGLPVWYAVMQKIGKHKAWSLSLSLAGASVLMPAFLVPGPEAFLPYMLMFCVLVLCSGAGLVAPYSILADVVDYDSLRSGTQRAGAYFALFLLFVKANVALGGAIAFALLAAFGYDPALADNDATAVWGLKAAYAVIPSLLFIASAALLWTYPLNGRRHDIVRRRLEQRRIRAERAV
ncbi:MAG: MFS transporter [Parvibaculum sp.]